MDKIVKGTRRKVQMTIRKRDSKGLENGRRREKSKGRTTRKDAWRSFEKALRNLRQSKRSGRLKAYLG